MSTYNPTCISLHTSTITTTTTPHRAYIPYTSLATFFYPLLKVPPPLPPSISPRKSQPLQTFQMPSQTANYQSHLSSTNMSNSSGSSSGSHADNNSYPSMSTTTSPPPTDVLSYSKMMLDHQRRQMERSNPNPDARRRSDDRHHPQQNGVPSSYNPASSNHAAYRS